MSEGRRTPLFVGCNVAVIGALAAIGLLEAKDGTAYYRLVQEDGPLEWATVVLLLPAAWMCVRAARRGGDWFWWGLGAFCVFFAGEEISWGQRLMAYQPPEYFLEHNSQQELNVHNLFKQYVRTKYLLLLILWGWGVALPLLDRFVPPVCRAGEKLRVVVPPVGLGPAFAAIALVLHEYPWKYTGEVAEAAFALVLLMTVAVESYRDGEDRPLAVRLGATAVGAVLVGAAVPPVLGVLLHGSDAERAAMVEREVAALAADWHAQAEADDDEPSGCKTHIRIFTWVRKHDYDEFRKGAFAALDIDETRREFFLDPWNNPYWVRSTCKKRRDKTVFIYSFGPDAQRDSTKKALAGDDLGTSFEP